LLKKPIGINIAVAIEFIGVITEQMYSFVNQLLKHCKSDFLLGDQGKPYRIMVWQQIEPTCR
jgi:hypothetical protein